MLLAVNLIVIELLKMLGQPVDKLAIRLFGATWGTSLSMKIKIV